MAAEAETLRALRRAISAGEDLLSAPQTRVFISSQALASVEHSVRALKESIPAFTPTRLRQLPSDVQIHLSSFMHFKDVVSLASLFSQRLQEPLMEVASSPLEVTYESGHLINFEEETLAYVESSLKMFPYLGLHLTWTSAYSTETLQSSPKITSLSISDRNVTPQGFSEALHAVAGSAVTCIELKFIHRPTEFFLNISARLPFLEISELSIYIDCFVEGLPQGTWEGFLESLKNSSLTSLSIDSECSFPRVDLSDMLRVIPQTRLRRLNLCNITEERNSIFPTEFMENMQLEELSIEYILNEFGDAFLSQLLACLERSSLRVLSLSNNNIDMGMLAKICATAVKMPQLRKLKISKNASTVLSAVELLKQMRPELLVIQ